MIYTGYKIENEELVIKESSSREILETEGFEYIASSKRDKEYLEFLLLDSSK